MTISFLKRPLSRASHPKWGNSGSISLSDALTEEVKKKIGAHAVEANTKLGMQICEGCDLKTCRKDCKGNAAKHVWIPEPDSLVKRHLGIPALRDQALHDVVGAAAHPIVECQADPRGFGFRPKRSPVDAIALLVGHLEQQCKSNAGSELLPVKVTKRA